MREKELPENYPGLKHYGRLLKQELEETEHRLEELNKDQSAKMNELKKVKEELEELNNLYNGKKKKK